ncbi:hypothetical protein LYNGBM3L_17340 [Moorena producens 3L]|uniref:Uncharacterized protein n=1 Tax=Moorena producens 3L TaxID=489825 RepID=F4XSF5_9CYAN|nr:hypothetical protein LYNGBM3L_17340 [Moorena producens 3L]
MTIFMSFMAMIFRAFHGFLFRIPFFDSATPKSFQEYGLRFDIEENFWALLIMGMVPPP